jgi:lipopolysaccharide transport system ATP-binding protein
MDDKPVIKVHNISKRYTITHGGDTGKNDTLRDKISGGFRRITHGGAAAHNRHKEDFWALRDVSFEVHRGEVLGVIGKNGAGKSTLLKILSRVINPTHGSFTINGTSSSLLEVGTGFHPELTGRENVYFNGALLGMSKKEIDRRFDDIVQFSEIEKFLDIPVKRYSSGMNVRLGFAIAANLDSDIMIIDEALAVGDAAFRQKGQDVMRQRATSGKTIVFVSHATSAIQQICDRVIYLDHGRLIATGTPDEMIELYLGNTKSEYGTAWVNKNEIHPEKASPRKIILQDDAGDDLERSSISYGNGLRVYYEINVPEPSKNLSVGISLLNEANTVIFRSANTDQENGQGLIKPGLNRLHVDIPLELLKEGDYLVAADVDLQHKGRLVHPVNTDAKVRFTLVSDDSRPAVWNTRYEGVVKPLLRWKRS